MSQDFETSFCFQKDLSCYVAPFYKESHDALSSTERRALLRHHVEWSFLVVQWDILLSPSSMAYVIQALSRPKHNSIFFNKNQFNLRGVSQNFDENNRLRSTCTSSFHASFPATMLSEWVVVLHKIEMLFVATSLTVLVCLLWTDWDGIKKLITSLRLLLSVFFVNHPSSSRMRAMLRERRLRGVALKNFQTRTAPSLYTTTFCANVGKTCWASRIETQKNGRSTFCCRQDSVRVELYPSLVSGFEVVSHMLFSKTLVNG